MPLFRCNNQIHYFAHVPKCGGQSVEAYLEKRFGPLAFVNNEFLMVGENKRWTKSSPQHVDTEALAFLFPEGWITSSFAVVRHPLTRVISAYNFGSTRRVSGIPPRTSIESWFNRYLKGKDRNPFLFDNHLRPQCDIVPESAKVFQLEDGLQNLVEYLDHRAGDENGPREIEHVNAYTHGTTEYTRTVPVTEKFKSLVNEFYEKDLERFGYKPDPVLDPDHGPLCYQMPLGRLSFTALCKKTKRRLSKSYVQKD